MKISLPIQHNSLLAATFAGAMFFLTPGPASAAVTEKFTTVGTINWTCPDYVTSVQVECWGGGGAGGGSFVNGGTANAGGGGGGGGAYARLIVPVTPGNIYPISIPAAASCPTSGFTNGQKYNGSSVSFSGDGAITVTANGGVGGASAVVTGATAISGAAGAGGAAGTGLDAAWKGGNAVFWSSGNGGGGGGGAGDLAAGGNSAASNGSFGAGGSGSDPDHAGGPGGAAKNGAGVGSNASSPAGGGGGAKSTAASASSRAGGAGGLGRIILTYTPVFPTIVKEDNTVILSGGTSWVGGLAPDANKVAMWNSTVNSANTTALGADVTWLGIAIENPNGSVSINPGNILTLGDGGIDLSTTNTADLTLNCHLALGAANIWNVATGRTLTLGGAVSGNFPVTKQGGGRAVFFGSNSYTGDTTISGGTVQLGATELIPDGIGKGNVAVNGTLDLNGHAEIINGLSGAGIIDNAAATSISTLTVGGNDQSGTFNGVLKNTGSSATLNLSKAGTGTLVLGGVNTLSGEVSVTGGTLAFNKTAPLNNVSSIAMSGETTLRPDVANGVVSAPITIGAANTKVRITAHSVDSSTNTTQVPFTLGGAISGDGGVDFVGIESTNDYSRIDLNAACVYEGATLITCSNELASEFTEGNQNIFIRLGVENALPVTTVLKLDGGFGAPAASAPGRYCEVNLNGKNQTLAGLENVPAGSLRLQRLVNSSGTPATLTINNAGPHTYAGQLGWVSGIGSAAYNNLNLTKSGIGTQTFSGELRYSGNTTINAGTLRLDSTNPNNESATVTIAATGASLQLNFGGSDTVGRLFIGASQKAAGTYGHSSTGATNGGLGVGALDASFASGTGTLTVTTGPGYASWQSANSNLQTIDLDHDNDGVKNGVEYFLFGATSTTGFTALPGVINNSGTLSVTWPKAAGYTGTYGTDFVVETSDTLAGAWTTEVLSPNPGFTVTITGNDVRYTFPSPLGTKKFSRLKVTGP